MKKILNKLLFLIAIIASFVFGFIVVSLALSLIAVIFGWLGKIGYWYLNLSVPIRIISSLVIVGIYLIGIRKSWDWKKIFNSIINFWEDK